jgi:hypothetical protein
VILIDPVEEATVGMCRACELELEDAAEFAVCAACARLVEVETAQLLLRLGPLGAIGTVAQVADTKQSLAVLYASTALGPNADRIAQFLGSNRTTTRQYGMRFRAARIWTHDEVLGPWSASPWLSPAFCRLFLMDALVGSGLAVRGKGRWEFIADEPARAA